VARFDYNPLTNQLDLVDSPAGYINGVVDDPTLLPVTLGTPALDSVYLAKAGSGVWLINRKPAGLYCRVANNGDLDDWQYLGAFPEVNADGNWALYNSADPTKELKFDVSNVTTGTTRTLTVPDKSGTLATTDAADLATGTLADARLSTNVPLKDASNTFAQNQTLDGTNNVAPNQTAASGSSIMTRDLGDARFVRQLVGTTLPTASYSSSSNHNAWIVERWTTTTGAGNLSQNTSLRGVYVRGLFCLADGTTTAANRKSLIIAPYTGYSSTSQGLVYGHFRTGGILQGDFVAKSNFVDLLANRVSSRLRMWSSGVASKGFRYRFSANFAANAGDTIEMSPSGHTFVVDETITDATVFTNETTGGVFIRSISSGRPTTGDTSLTVNGGASISTTFQINSATNSGTNPDSVLFPSTTAWNIWSSNFGDQGFYEIFFTE